MHHLQPIAQIQIKNKNLLRNWFPYNITDKQNLKINQQHMIIIRVMKSNWNWIHKNHRNLFKHSIRIFHQFFKKSPTIKNRNYSKYFQETARFIQQTTAQNSKTNFVKTIYRLVYNSSIRFLYVEKKNNNIGVALKIS